MSVFKPKEKFYRKLLYQGEILKGGIMVGDIAGAGILYWLAYLGKKRQDLESLVYEVPLQYDTLFESARMKVVNY